MFRSPLLLSLSVSFFSLILLVISILVFYPLSCLLYWCTYRNSSTLMIKSEAIIDSISCCRVWQWEVWGREQGKEGGRDRGRGEGTKIEAQGWYTSNIMFSFVLSFTDCIGWWGTLTWCHKAREGRRACGGWWYLLWHWNIFFNLFYSTLSFSLFSF